MPEICTEFKRINECPCYPGIHLNRDLSITCFDDYFIVNDKKYEYEFGSVKSGTYDLDCNIDNMWDCGTHGVFIQHTDFNMLINSDYIKISPPEISFFMPGVIIKCVKPRYYIEGYDILCDGYSISDKYIYYDIDCVIYKIERPPYSELKMVSIPIECV